MNDKWDALLNLAKIIVPAIAAARNAFLVVKYLREILEEQIKKNEINRTKNIQNGNRRVDRVSRGKGGSTRGTDIRRKKE
jgi:hypothetical protein